MPCVGAYGLPAPLHLDGSVLRRIPGRPPSHPSSLLTFWRALRFPQHLFRRLRSDQQSLRRPDCTSSRLRAKSTTGGWPSWQPPRSQVALIHTLDQALVACWALECVTTPGSRRSCPGWAAAHLTWILTIFTSLVCCVGALPGQMKSVIPVSCGDNLPLRAARFLLLCVSLEVFADQTAPRQHVNWLFSSRVCHSRDEKVLAHAGSGPSRVHRRLLKTCRGDTISLAILVVRLACWFTVHRSLLVLDLVPIFWNN